MSLTESVVCLDWGEGSGLEVWDSECNTAYPGKANIDIHIQIVYVFMCVDPRKYLTFFAATKTKFIPFVTLQREGHLTNYLTD